MEKLIAWVEIPTTNFKRGVKFYEKILGIRLKVNDFGHEKMAHFPSDEGAVIFAKGYEPSDKGVLISLNIGNDMDNTLKLIKEHGGEILVEKTKIQAEGRDYFAIFKDCEGNRIGLYGN